MHTIGLNIFLFLSVYGFVCVAADLGYAIGCAAVRIDKLSRIRAYNSIGQAILDYEFDRGVNGMSAWNYARYIMRGAL